jgi:DNA-binding beta-propeller fold protein YncE
MMKCIRAVAVFMVLFSAIGFAQSGPGYHVVKKTLVGGEGGWDYLFVDANARRLYLSHNDKVIVLDADEVKVVGEIPNTQGVHGIAVAPEFNHGFTSNGRSSTVTMFDLRTMKVIKEVPVTGKNPDAILYDPFSKNLFTFNGRSQDASVLNPESGDTVATIFLGGKPEFAVTDLKGHVYVNIEDKNEIAAIDAKSLKILSRWSIAPGDEPSGLAMDVANRRLFSVCGNKMMVVCDPDSGKVVTTVPIGEGPDACKFDPETRLVFSANGEGTITVIREESPTKFVVVETVKTQPRARTMEIDSKSHALFTVTAEFGETPKPTAEHPRPRPPIVPNTFVVLQLQK